MKISLFSYAVILLVTSCPTNGEHQDADTVSITDPLTEKRFDGNGTPFFFHLSGDSGDRILLNIPQVNLCDSYPGPNEFKPLTVNTVSSIPDSLFKIEGAKGIKFIFSTCGQTDRDTFLLIGDSNKRVASGDDNCPGYDYSDGAGGPDVLTFTPPDNGIYYLSVKKFKGQDFTTNVVWSTDKDWDFCLLCGPSIIAPAIAASADTVFKCCDRTTGDVGPECCDKTSYDPEVSSCCGNGSLVDGVNNEAACVPSTAPSTPPTPMPSSSPTTYPMLVCGPSIVSLGGADPPKCCDSTTGAVDPECCGTLPYDPKVSSCCGDGSLVDGVNNEAACAPSAAPSSPPSFSPTSAPSSPPSFSPTSALSSPSTPLPSSAPSSSPSSSPSSAPSSPPTPIPSAAPSSPPTSIPSAVPSSSPSSTPSAAPSSSPSAVPSSPPTTSFPSSSPSSPPTEHQTCDKVDPCHYELDKDTFEIIETYFPVCVQDTEMGNLIYRQECYANSTIFGFGSDDIDPEHPDNKDRFIVACGCCPMSADEGLPETITDVKGVDKMNVCNGGIDCINAMGKEVVQSVRKKSVKVDVCIDGTDDESKDNFYIPADGESITCGFCDGSNIIV